MEGKIIKEDCLQEDFEKREIKKECCKENFEEDFNGEEFKTENFKGEDFKGEGFKGEWMYVLPTEAFEKYIIHPLVKRLYLTDVGYFPRAHKHFRERKDGIAENIYIFCVEGCGNIELEDGKRYVLHENEAFCIPSNIGHRYYADKDNPWSILWVHFKGTDVDIYPINERKIVHFETESTAKQMLTWFQILWNVLGQDYTLGNFIYITQVISLVLAETYYRADTAMYTPNALVTEIIRYMYKHLDKEITLKELTEEFDISVSYICSRFKNSTGHGPIDFLIKLKMDKACKLLKSTDMYVYEVAHALGYKDEYYFSRIFRKVIGCSPKEYRKLL